MKQKIPWIVTIVAVALLAFTAFRPESTEGEHWREFGALPVLVNGRVKPLDTVARSSLLVLHDKQTLRVPDAPALSAVEWLAELCFTPERADTRKVFVIHDPQVLSLFGWQQSGEKDFSFEQISPHLEEVIRQARLADQVEADNRSMFQRHVLQLYSQLETYQRLKNSLQPEDTNNFAEEVARLEQAIVPLSKLARMRTAGQTLGAQNTDALGVVEDRYGRMANLASMRVVPPLDPSAVKDPDVWENIGTTIVQGLHDGSLHPVVKQYAAIGAAYRAGDANGFNAAVASLRDWFATDHGAQLTHTARESFFNRFEAFYVAMIIYVLVAILAAISWLIGPGAVRRTAFLLMGLALAVHTFGIGFRMYLEGRPPVTNLYSSALFVGWAAVVLAFVLEKIYRNGFGSVVAGVFGFLTLLIAHNLSFMSGGDTMEAMRAVLDNNFWLATHVVAITVGYSATFLAGCLAVVYILIGVLTPWLGKQFDAGSAVAMSAATGSPRVGAVADATKVKTETNARALARMTYGIVCFATLFSFVGTVLGGIWADQSWGRFWGWDPKENGAALIVIWNAIILHARWGGYVRDRGLAVLAVGGNIVTSWSWFGVNMLGVGLHSYGFMDKAFPFLIAWVVANLAIMAVGLIPLVKWRSPMVVAKPPAIPEHARRQAGAGAR